MATPFDEPSTLPYALPPFDDVRTEHYRPAFDAGMAEHRAEVEAIATDPHPPTFENTLVALERSGQLLQRVEMVFSTVTSADSTDALRDLEAELSPLLAAHRDAVVLDARLYARVRAVHDDLEDAPGLSDEDRRLVDRTLTEMTLAGAGLDDAGKERLTAVNQELSSLTTTFERNLLEDTNDAAVHVTDEAELAGLDDGAVSAAAGAAADRGLDGWLVTLPLYTGHPWLATLTDRGLRQRIMEASLSRGRRGNAFDNREVLLQIVRLRAERAELLGFRDHASVVTADETAGDPDAVAGLLSSLVTAATANARDERAVRSRTVGYEVESWDWAYATEVLRGEQFAADSGALRPYLEADRVLVDGVFHAATALYGLRFTCVRGLRRARRTRGAVPARPVHAGRQARRGVDEPGRGAVAPARHAPGRREQPQRAEARRGIGHAADAGRGGDAVPRVRARAARLDRPHDLPAVLGHERRA
jgi:peptidyl-dipeptidase Dcp